MKNIEDDKEMDQQDVEGLKKSLHLTHKNLTLAQCTVGYANYMVKRNNIIDEIIDRLAERGILLKAAQEKIADEQE